MKLEFNVDYVIGKLDGIASVVNQKNVVPILENLLFVADKDKRILKVMASDNETWIGCVMQLERLEYEGGKESFCINAKNLVSTLKNLSGHVVSIDVDIEKRVAVGDYGNGRFKLPLFDADAFPFPSDIKESAVDIVLDAHAVADMISRTRNFIGNMVTMPQFGGLHFDFSENNVTVVASDGQRLACVRSRNESYGGQRVGFTMPQKAASVIMSVMQYVGDGEYVSIKSDLNNVSFSLNGWKMCTRLIEASYPAYERLLAQDGFFSVHADVKELMLSIKRVMCLGDRISNLIVFSVDGGTMKMSAENIDFSTASEESISCENGDERGVPFNIGFNGNFLLQMLQNIQTDRVCIKLKAPNLAAMILNDDDEDGAIYSSLLFPMQFNQ